MCKSCFCKLWKKTNKERVGVYNREYFLKNRDVININANKRQREKRRSSPTFRIAHNLRTRIRDFIKRSSKSKSSVEYLGCSHKDWRIHIESLFTNGMTWDNYGKWHIDHIRPLSSFDLSLEENVFIAFNYKNTQPLWAKDNLIKSNKTQEYLFREIRKRLKCSPPSSCTGSSKRRRTGR